MRLEENGSTRSVEFVEQVDERFVGDAYGVGSCVERCIEHRISLRSLGVQDCDGLIESGWRGLWVPVIRIGCRQLKKGSQICQTVLG